MSNFRVTRRRVAIAGATVAAIAAGGSAVALATGGSSGNAYQGCLSRIGGAIYNVHVNPASAPRCFMRDTPISWNQSGPAGPAGGLGKVTVRTASETVVSGSAAELPATCNPGEIAVGGGAALGGGGGMGLKNAYLGTSRPDLTSTPPRAWVGIGTNYSEGDIEFTVYAVCAAG